MILTSIIADIATSEEPDVDNSAEFEALVRLQRLKDPRYVIFDGST